MIIQKIKNIFKLKTKGPQPRTLYAVLAGNHLGKFILFIHPESAGEHYDALAVGQGREISTEGFEPLSIPTKDVIFGLENKIIDKVEKIGKDINDILCEEWKLRKEREQINNDKSDN